MIWFWALAAFLILAALAALLRPLVWRPGRASDPGELVVAMFRRQLSDIDVEIGQGRLAPDEATAARTEIIRRMLTVTDQEGEQTSPGSTNAKELSWRIGAAVGVAGLMPAAALAVYFAVGNPAAINPTAAARATPTAANCEPPPADSALTTGWRKEHVLPVLQEVLEGRRALRVKSLEGDAPLEYGHVRPV